MNQGIVPNRFPDAGETPEYNTADATLWMFQAVRPWLQAGGSRDFLRDVFYPARRRLSTGTGAAPGMESTSTHRTIC